MNASLTQRLLLAGLLVLLSACSNLLRPANSVNSGTAIVAKPKPSLATRPAAKAGQQASAAKPGTAVNPAVPGLEQPLLLSVAPAQYQPLPEPGPGLIPVLPSLPAPIIAPVIATPEPVAPVAAATPPAPAAPGESAPPPPGFLLPGQPVFSKPDPKTDNNPASGMGIPVATGSIRADTKPAPPAVLATPSALPSLTFTPALPATPPPVTSSARSTDNMVNLARALVSNKLPPVYIYASPSSQNYFAAGGLNYQNNIDIWQLLLRRQDIPFEVITNLNAIKNTSALPDKMPTLILPSAVALSEAERRELRRFHDQGGALLATWLCGVRNENGEWLGFQFMESVLDTKVLGTTQGENDDNYLMPYGDNPVSHQLPAGLRVWTERVPEWYPLRLSGANLAAQVMDWSRTVNHAKPAGLISYSQRPPQANHARSVVLGYPERLWFSADPKAFDAVAGDAMFWLMRQPAVYLASWPYPYRSAFMLSINASDFAEETDNAFAKQTESIGWHGTYYLLSQSAEAAKPLLTKLQQRGHDIAYFGDRMVSFQNVSPNQQKKRLDTMQNEIKQAELEPTTPLGFRAPMEAYDDTTLRLLRARGVSHIVTDPGASDARLPVLSPGPVGNNGEELVLLPRSMSGPEDLIAEGKPAEALKNFLAEVELADNMGSLGVITVPTHSNLTPAQWGEVLNRLKEREKKIWLTTANQAASWWRERERVKVSLNTDVSPALLTVEVSGDAPLQQAMTLLVNLPQPGRSIRLTADGHNLPAPQVAPVDNLRSALILPKLGAGKYDWYLSFGPAL